jgi:hypothetical protein
MDFKSIIGEFFNKLPFIKLAEKIPTEIRAKFPLLGKVIPFANHIACGMAVLLLVVAVSAASGKDDEDGKAPTKAAEDSSKSSDGGKTNVEENPASDFSYSLTEDGQGIVIKRFETTTGKYDLVIPAKIEDLPVLEIADEFSKYSYFTSIALPDTVRKIGYHAFQETSIKSFFMPDSVTELGLTSPMGWSHLFSESEYLEEIRVSDNLEILPFGFASMCTRLKKINLPKNLKKIEINAFSGCMDLTELVIPDTLQSIQFGDNEIFKHCTKLPLKTRARLKELGYKGEI